MHTAYGYRGRDRQGGLVVGRIIATSEEEVAAHLRAHGQYATYIREENKLLPGWFAGRRLSTRELAVFCRQFALLVGAGVSLVSALRVLHQQADHVRLRAALEGVCQGVQEGKALSRALGEYPRVFPELLVGMTEAGEASGALEALLARLAVHFEKEHRLREKVRSALVYPLTVVVLAIGVVFFLFAFVLPGFTSFFDSLQLPLPPLTRGLLAVSSFLQHYGWWVLALCAVAAAGAGRLRRQPGWRRRMDRAVLLVPVVGLLGSKVALARLCRTLGTLLRSGMPLLAALELAQRTTDNVCFQASLAAARQSVRNGQGLSATLAETGLFPPLVLQLVAVGEETGELDAMLEKAASFYEDDVDEMASRLGALLEPALLVVLGVVIGGIVLSIMLPLFDSLERIAI